MPVPPPLSDPSHIETRLRVVADMLDRAVAEARRALADICGSTTTDNDAPNTDARSTDR